ncbi:hypothetical protein H8E88_24325 [candidate division KSB1 bacterium]|nr:hypothetical protein [candidate division KSB1 bacterium]
MMPLDLTFRKMLVKYIPQVTEYDLRKYENLVAFRHQIRHEQAVTAVGGDDIKTVSAKAQKIFEDKKADKYFEQVHKLEIAARLYALEQRKFLQITPTAKGGWNYIKKSFNYRLVQVQTLPWLWYNKITYSLRQLTFKKLAILVAAIVLVIFGFWIFCL